MTNWQKAFVFVSVAAVVLIFLRLDSTFGWAEWAAGEVSDWFARRMGWQGPVVPPYLP